MSEVKTFNGEKTCHWKSHFAWTPKLCNNELDPYSDDRKPASYRFFEHYWKCQETGKLISPDLMSKMVCDDAAEAFQKGLNSGGAIQVPSGPASSLNFPPTASWVSVTSPGGNEPIKILEEKIHEMIEEKFKIMMDELFENLPAEMIPAEQIKRIYEKMGYPNE